MDLPQVFYANQIYAGSRQNNSKYNVDDSETEKFILPGDEVSESHRKNTDHTERENSWNVFLQQLMVYLHA